MKKLSIVLPTFNRKNTLQTTLAKLAEQTYPASEFEVIVVDDASKDGTPELVRSLISSSPYALKYLRNKENRGPGASQNWGILEAQGDLVLILADDIWATPKLVEEHMKSHAQNPEPHVSVLGKVLQSPYLPKTTFLKHWNPFRLDRIKKGQKELSFLYFYGCNISLKRSFLLENGLFREDLGAAHEDIELGYRLSQKGLRILYSEAALGYHHHVETLQSVCHRGYMRGLNWQILVDNVPDRQIYGVYKVFSLKAGLPTVGWLLFWHLARSLCFNRVTVPYILFPLLEKAETNPLMATLVTSVLYRGVLSFYFSKGRYDARKQISTKREHSVQSLVETEAKLKITFEERSKGEAG